MIYIRYRILIMVLLIAGTTGFTYCVAENGSANVVTYDGVQKNILLDISKSESLKLKDGYELIPKSVDINENEVYLELAKNGSIIDSAVVATANEGNDTFSYFRNSGTAESYPTIRMHFKNAFKGADIGLATLDNIWQVSDTNPSHLLVNQSGDNIVMLGVPLKIKEGYKVLIRSIDNDGNKVFLELSKNGSFIDSAVVTTANRGNDTFTYSNDNGTLVSPLFIKVQFRNLFVSTDSSIATFDALWHNTTFKSKDHRVWGTVTSFTPITFEEGYLLQLKSIDIKGKKAYVELTKNGKVVASKVIIPRNEVDSNYIYNYGGEVIKVHFKDAFRSPDAVIVGNISQI